MPVRTHPNPPPPPPPRLPPQKRFLRASRLIAPPPLLSPPALCSTKAGELEARASEAEAAASSASTDLSAANHSVSSLEKALDDAEAEKAEVVRRLTRAGGDYVAVSLVFVSLYLVSSFFFFFFFLFLTPSLLFLTPSFFWLPFSRPSSFFCCSCSGSAVGCSGVFFCPASFVFMLLFVGWLFLSVLFLCRCPECFVLSLAVLLLSVLFPFCRLRFGWFRSVSPPTFIPFARTISLSSPRTPPRPSFLLVWSLFCVVVLSPLATFGLLSFRSPPRSCSPAWREPWQSWRPSRRPCSRWGSIAHTRSLQA